MLSSLPGIVDFAALPFPSSSPLSTLVSDVLYLWDQVGNDCPLAFCSGDSASLKETWKCQERPKGTSGVGAVSSVSGMRDS